MPVQTSSLPGQAAMRCIDFGLVLMENESVREPPKATGLVCNALISTEYLWTQVLGVPSLSVRDSENQ